MCEGRKNDPATNFLHFPAYLISMLGSNVHGQDYTEIADVQTGDVISGVPLPAKDFNHYPLEAQHET